jgi:hypothetical protein
MWGLAMGGVTPREVLKAATIDGAKIIGFDQDLGSLEPGKLADLVVLDRNHLDVTGLADGEYTLMVFAKSAALPIFTAVQTVVVTVATPVPQLRMAIDLPAVGSEVTGPFRVAGWALVQDGAAAPGIAAVHAWAYPVGGGAPQFVGAATLGHSRPDVAATYGAGFTTSGYNLDVPAPRRALTIWRSSENPLVRYSVRRGRCG